MLLEDSLDFFRLGMSSLYKDGFTVAFEPKPKTYKHPLYFLGMFVRYGILLPFRYPRAYQGFLFHS